MQSIRMRIALFSKDANYRVSTWNEMMTNDLNVKSFLSESVGTDQVLTFKFCLFIYYFPFINVCMALSMEKQSDQNQYVLIISLQTRLFTSPKTLGFMSRFLASLEWFAFKTSCA